MTQKTRADFKTDKNTAFADNTAGDIGADDLRAQMDHLADSALFPEDSVPSHIHAASDLTSGTLADARVAESNVTQHQAALMVTESQISDLGSYITGYTVTESDVTAHEAALTITESQISDLGNYQVELSEGAFIDGDKTKLDGIETGATSNPGAITGITGEPLGDLSDVSISSPSNGQVLKYNGSVWVNGTDEGGGSGFVDTSGTPVALDFARFTDANTIEGRSPAEVRADLDLEIGTDVQAYDANLPTWPASVSATEVGYLDGVTSAIQTQLAARPTSDPSGVTGADVITNMMSLTQAEYDAIGTPNASTAYWIKG